MGLDPKLLGANVRDKLSPEDRKSLGIQSNAEITAKQDVAFEHELHKGFLSWLRVHERGPIPYIYSRTDRKSTIQEGWPDVTVLFHGRACCIEFKVYGNHCSEEQRQVAAALTATGTPYRVCYSVLAAITFTREHLGL